MCKLLVPILTLLTGKKNDILNLDHFIHDQGLARLFGPTVDINLDV